MPVPPPSPSSDEHHIGAAEGFLDVFAVIGCSLSADLWVAARAQPSSQVSTNVKLYLS